MRVKPVLLLLFSFLLMVGGLVFQARAVTSIWTGAGADANWGTSGNWAGGAVPGQARDFVWFGNDGLGTNRLDQNYTVRVLVVTNSSQTQPQVVDLNGYTLTLTNGLQVGYQTNNSFAVFTNGTLRFGVPGTSAVLYVGYNGVNLQPVFTNNRMRVHGILDAVNLSRIWVGYSSFNASPKMTLLDGFLDLSVATFVSKGVTNKVAVNELMVGSGYQSKGVLLLNPAITEIEVGTLGVPGGVQNYLNGRLDLGANSQLRKVVVTNTFNLGMGGPGCIDNWPTNVDVQIGLPGKPGVCNIGYNEGWGTSEGRLTLTGGAFRAYVSTLNVGVGDASFSDSATGVLDLASAAVLIGDETNKVKLAWLSVGGNGDDREALNKGGGVGLLKLPATVTDIVCGTFDLGNSYSYALAAAAGILDLGRDSQLARLTISNSFYMGSGSSGALLGLPTNTEIRIGTADKAATLKIASKANCPSRASLVLTNNPVWLYLGFLQVADNSSWQYGGPSGTLNLAAADVRAMSITGAVTIAASLGGLTNKDSRGFVMLPAVDASFGSLLVGNRHGPSRGLLELFGTRLAVTQFVFIGNSGVITNHLAGAPGGLDLAFSATNLFNVAPTGRLVLAFDANPTNAPAFTWGLRMAGDARPHVQNLKDTGRLSWTTAGLSPFWTNRVSIVYTNGATQVGLDAVPDLTVVADSVSDVTPASATLHGGLISAGGGEPALVHMVWDTADSGSASLDDWEHRQALGIFTDGQSFQTNLTGLLSGTTYVFRCFASNSTGTAWSDPVTFQTIYAPVVLNTGAGNIGYFNARLQGQILETGWDTPVCLFYYWEAGSGATNYIPMGSQSGSFGSVITNLSLGTAYSYYFTASNSAGLTASPVQTFRTLVGVTWCVATNGLESATGTNWDNPLRSISNALRKAVYGDLILVTNGNYYLAAVISVTNAVYVKSLAGAGFTLLNGSNTIPVLKVSHASAEVRGFTLTNGYAYSGTTGIPGADVSAGTLRDSRILDCMYAVGGTVAGLRLSGSSAKAERCVIANNYLDKTQPGGGVGGVLISAGTLSQCLVTRNRSSATPNMTGDFLASAGVFQSGGVVQHCTIAGNIGNGATLGGLRQTGGAVSNSIIAWNSDPRYAVGDHANDPNVRQTGGAITYSCTFPAVAGAGNVSGDPRFADVAAGDFRLMPGSPALDSGAPVSPFGADGLGWPKDGDGDGVAAADMGCLEALAAGEGDFRLGFSASPLSGVATQTVVFTAAAAGPDAGIANVEWSFGDGQTLSGAGLTTVSHGYGPGVYPVSLTVTRSVGGTVSTSLPVSLFVAPAEIFVSTNGGCVFPFDTWGKATTNLQEAIEAAGSNGSTSTLVRVAAGTYLIGKYFPLQVRKPVLVRSEEGPGRTVLTRVLDVYCYQLVHVVHPDAVLEGFTITNGFGGLTAQWNYCGGGVYLSAGTLRNCWVVGGEAPNGGGIWMQGGLVDRCKVAGNKANSGATYGGGGGILCDAGTVRNSLVLQNMTTYTNATGSGGGITLMSTNARAENCTVAGNAISNWIAGPTYSGGGIYRKVDGAAVVNCIVWGNTKAGLPNDIASSGATTNGVRYTCSPDVRAGNGNTAADPAFLNAAAGDYRLSGLSPCIDTGEVQAWTMEGFDYTGRERYKGKGVDMGAVESRPLPGTVILIQ